MPEQKIALRSPQERYTERRLWLVHGDGVLRDVPAATLDPESPDLRLLPYGAVVLPTTDVVGNAVVVVKQPGQESRQDVLLIENPSSVTIRSKVIEERPDVRPGRSAQTRLRVRMACLAKDCGDQPASVAVLRIATKTKGRQPLGDKVRARLATLGYTIRPGDQVGWFEYGEDAFPDPPFRHGYPDIATRDTHVAGVLGQQHRIAVAEALRAYTVGSAQILGWDSALGILAPGKVADCICLDRDPLALPVDQVRHVRVTRTIVHGRPLLLA